MVFELQRYLEDLFERRQLSDNDQYAVKLANLYDQHKGASDLARRMRRVSTAFFRVNGLDRAEYEASLLRSLDRKFKKKSGGSDTFPGGVVAERRKLRRGRRSIKVLLTNFRDAVEARAVDSFWNSRKNGRLKNRPESIAQGLLSVFAKGALGGAGLVQRELGSGTGWVDVQIILSRTPHLVEVKMLRGKATGAAQLDVYMRHEGRREGWLVFVDARPPGRKSPVPDSVRVKSGTIRVIVVDINPIPPSRAA